MDHEKFCVGRANVFRDTSPALASPDNPKPRIPSRLRQRGRVQFPAGTLKRRVARNVAVATSRASGAQHLAAWLQPADGDHKSPLAANGDLNFARRAKILTISSTKRHICDIKTLHSVAYYGLPLHHEVNQRDHSSNARADGQKHDDGPGHSRPRNRLVPRDFSCLTVNTKSVDLLLVGVGEQINRQ